MYNRYIPDGGDYTWVQTEYAPTGRQEPEPRGRKNTPFTDLFAGKGSLSGLLSSREGAGLSGLLQSLHLENIDSGDILLLLIMLYLLIEGDELELVIALGLTLIMGLGDNKDGDASCDEHRAQSVE